jgi:4-diphosphocytidyl-2-C-methyl-D-erythritol kinase
MSAASVTEFAPAKINLALHVLGRRADGYHELDSIVAFADVGDSLTLTPTSETSLNITGPFAGHLSSGADNLVLRAYALLNERASLPPVAFHLEKNLPIASGIGGGSADAAAALRGLIRMFDLKLVPDEVNALALKLGADVPVCFHGKACRMRGIGERLEESAFSLPPAIVLVNPGKATSTPDVFRHMGLKPGDNFGTAIPSHSDAASWRNDLAKPAMSLVPEIETVIEALRNTPGIACARMSGSGATCFGLANSFDEAQAAASILATQHSSWWVKAAKLME